MSYKRKLAALKSGFFVAQLLRFKNYSYSLSTTYIICVNIFLHAQKYAYI